MKKILLLIVAILLIVSGSAFAGIVGSKHDLTPAGTGLITGGANLSACEYCHTPHNPLAGAAAPLWNKVLTTAATYETYTLTNTGGTIGAPGGASLTCLTCHDGTLDVGDVINLGGATAETLGFVLGDAVMLGTSNSTHPIGVVMSSGRAYIATPATTLAGDAVNYMVGADSLKIYGGDLGVGTVECASCHNPHSNTLGTPFLKASRASICTDCHNEGI